MTNTDLSRSNPINNFDVVVLGAGPAGYVAAIRAAQKGYSVACIGKQLGGTCLQEGCIPSKFLLNISHQYDFIKNQAKDFGLKTQVEYDLLEIMSKKDKVISTLTSGIAHLFKKNKVTHFNTHAKLKIENGKKIVECESGERLQAKFVIIATGSKIIEIPFKKDDGVEIDNSRTCLGWQKAPKDLLVIGAGYIGLELASVWARFGANVKVVDLAERFLPFLDKDVSDYLLKTLKEQMQIQLGVSVAHIAKKGDRLHVELTNGEKIECDRVLSAVGRKAADKIWPDNIVMDGQFIKIDEHYRTNIEGIYAIGDIVGGALLAHKASDEAWCAVEHLAHTHPSDNDKKSNFAKPALPKVGHIPSVVYLHPEAATIGDNEEKLTKLGVPYNVTKINLAGNSRAMSVGETKGFVKILSEKDSGKVLGATIIGLGAEAMICQIAVAMSYEATVHDVASVCYPHPSVDEALRETMFTASVWGSAH